MASISSYAAPIVIYFPYLQNSDNPGTVQILHVLTLVSIINTREYKCLVAGDIPVSDRCHIWDCRLNYNRNDKDHLLLVLKVPLDSIVFCV